MPRRCPRSFHNNPVRVVADKILERLVELVTAWHGQRVLSRGVAMDETGHHAVQVASVTRVREPRKRRRSTMRFAQAEVLLHAGQLAWDIYAVAPRKVQGHLRCLLLFLQNGQQWGGLGQDPAQEPLRFS